MMKPSTPRSPVKRGRFSSGAGAVQAKRRTAIVVVVATVIVALALGLGIGLGVGLANKSKNGGNTVIGANGVVGSGKLDDTWCTQLKGAGVDLCMEYTKAVGDGKFNAASVWKQQSSASYSCAGITGGCLQDDLRLTKGGSSCTPILDGASCGAGKTCQAGYCGGLAASADDGTETADDHAAAVAKAQARAQAANASPDKDKPADPVPVDGQKAWGNFSATIDPTARMGRIPDAFLATSHEWTRLTDWGRNTQAFANIFKTMGPSPILRIGGASQDAMLTAPGKEVWDALVAMQKAANVRYLIGLPLWQSNAVELGRQIMKDARARIPPAALLGFELGNEPEFWPTGLGGYDGTPPQWVSGFQAYNKYSDRVAVALNPCTDKGPQPVLALPGWGNVNTQDLSWLRTVAAAGRCYMRELAVHYYPYVNNATIDAKGLLEQWLLDFGVGKFRENLAIARSYNYALRVSETNSLYGAGRAGLSETMAGALWCADALFAFAQAGASGFHFHWGFGGVPKEGGPPNVGVQTNFIGDDPTKPYPSPHIPWFGYLLFIDSTSPSRTQKVDATFVNVSPRQGASCKGNVKMWGLLADSGELRVVMMNKDKDEDCNMQAMVPDAYCSQANLWRLMPGKQGMYSMGGVTWRGQTYRNPNGVLDGAVQSFQVKPERVAGGDCMLDVAMPAASAAVLKIPRKTAG